MPKKVADSDKRVPLNCLIAPETRNAINRLRGLLSQGEYVDSVVCGVAMPRTTLDAVGPRASDGRGKSSVTIIPARSEIEIALAQANEQRRYDETPHAEIAVRKPLADWRAGRKPILKSSAK